MDKRELNNELESLKDHQIYKHIAIIQTINHDENEKSIYHDDYRIQYTSTLYGLTNILIDIYHITYNQYFKIIENKIDQIIKNNKRDNTTTIIKIIKSSNIKEI